MNVNLYHLNGKWIMVDCGSGFADSSLPGVDMVVADLSFIEQRKDDLLGLVLTHAHEDHIGAIQYLWNNLGCDIYATKFTRNFLELKLSEYSFLSDINMIEIGESNRFDLGPFNIEMIGLTHSAPEMKALMIRTDKGNIFHTGDWKFDSEPIVGDKSEKDKIIKCGEEGVMALVCDSTNVFNEGFSGSEITVKENLINIVKECNSLVVVTTFASNLARLVSIIEAASQSDRKIILTGRSLHRMTEAAKNSGYLHDIPDIIDETEFKNYDRSKILIISTGCQGEEMAATTKMANDIHRHVSLKAGDHVIFSSKIIPGNEKSIFKVFNILSKKKVNVITENDHQVHVSGHPSKGELKEMYEMIKPQIVVPVHGEPLHIKEHAKFARSLGIKFSLEPENGVVVDLNQDKPKIIETVANGYYAVDGNYLLPENSPIFKMRGRMRDNGIVIATIVLNKKFSIIGDPVISYPGLLDLREDKDTIVDIKSRVKESVYNRKDNNSSISKKDVLDKIESKIRNTIRKTIKEEINKYPPIIVNITLV
ncbi:MAG TPA: ribonuclease J [Candidatus Megaira endosymbiont of Hartmannula sinica]|nr:ribonuclease J [Candidatus Megaera endosymbiont of Hartmannula sinica]